MIMEVDELKEAKEVAGGEEAKQLQAARRERLRTQGFAARESQAIRDASFSSCDHGAPRGRPRSAMRRVRALGVTRRTRDVSFRSSRSFAVLLKRSQRAQASSSASRKSSPSAV